MPPHGRPGQGPRGHRPDMNQSQSIKQKKTVNDSTLLTIVGTLADSATNEALMFVTVGIMKQSDSTLVKGSFSDEKGEFEVKNIHPGSYYLLVSAVGYETLWKPIEVKNNTALGIVKMKQGAAVLEAVQITATRPMFAMEGEKMIYNVSEDPSVQDGTTSDALQNAPGVEVDIDGNVTLRGQSSVEIWINDRPSKLTSENLKTYLETLPANTLDHIEVISNPSAKYATESDAVINIITSAHIKKNHFISFGVNGSSTPSFRPWLSYMWANEKLSFNLYASGGRNISESESFSTTAYSPWNSDSNDYILYQRDTTEGYGNSKSWSGNINFNFDYEIDSMTNLSGWGAVNGNFHNSNSYSSVIRDLTFGGGDLLHYNDTTIGESNMIFGFGGFNYQHKFDNEGHNLRVNLFVHIDGDNNDGWAIRDFKEYTLNGYNKYYKDKTSDQSYDLSARYNRPLSKDMDFSAGLNMGYSKSTGNFNRMLWNDDDQDYTTFDTLRTYHYNNVETDASFDVNLTRRWGSFTAEVGTSVDIHNDRLLFENEYFPIEDRRFHDDTTLTRLVFRPSVHLSYYTQDMHNFKLNYTLRTYNPSAEQLSTFREYGEDSYFTGNRDLKPQLRHQMEAGWSKYITNFGFVGVDAYFNYSANEISSLDDVTSEADEFLERVINYSMPYNMGSSYRYGMTMHGTYRPNGFFNVRLYANVYNYGYSMDRGAQGILEDNKWSYSFNINTWYKFFDNYQIFASGSYNSPTIGLASLTKARYRFNFGIRGDFFKRKMSARIMVNDIFNWGYRFGSGSESTNPAFTGNRTNLSKSSRFITGGITFRFGKMELENRAKSGSEGDSSPSL